MKNKKSLESLLLSYFADGETVLNTEVSHFDGYTVDETIELLNLLFEQGKIVEINNKIYLPPSDAS